MDEDQIEEVAAETDEAEAAPTEPAVADAAPALIMENATTWIVRIEGVDFSIAADTPEPQIRETLSTQYPGARDATIAYDKVQIDGQLHKRLTFTKRGGTKGCPVEDLRVLLITVPPVTLATIRRAGSVSPETRGGLTFDQFLTVLIDSDGDIVTQEELWPQLAALPHSLVVVTLDGSR
ncbi:hypothetical protein EKD04_017355 [Chloroflexales bacterium ZM16-3]|nr:hypothetical protein [Chloroflexales bacterium ZM16-3]